jgi:hypothetical protein
MFISDRMRPGLPTPKKLWDPIWFFIQETVSFLVWFAIGGLLDSGVLEIKKLMLAYLIVRFGFAAGFLIAHGVAAIGWRVQLLSWLAFGVYTTVLCLRWALSKIQTWRSAANS